MAALDRLSNQSCRVGPKMDQNIAGGSRSRTDDSMSESSQKSRKSSKHKHNMGSFATEKAWIEGRLSYRRLVYRMIKDIENYCNEVICMVQNFLNVSPE